MYDRLFLVLQYSSALEKNKLFVKNLSFTCTKEALETLFGEVSYELYNFCSPEPNNRKTSAQFENQFKNQALDVCKT